VNFFEDLKTLLSPLGLIASRPSVFAVVLLMLAISGCRQPGAVTLALSVEESTGELRVQITNQSAQPLLVGDHFLGLINRAPGDLSVLVSGENGKLIPQCRSYDYFSPESVVAIKKNESLLLSTHVDAVAYTHCLNSPGTYALRAALGPIESHGFEEAFSSNIVEIAVTPEDVGRRTVSARQEQAAEKESGDGK
jgi:hypothetical protein